ncbi:MAG TPA: Gfo/Idh/MocA family oxidoreductase [Dongiaceae bacterium]|nr:Gfo/Idh/MocA family oxidoreductase [Dongiaceae bacterium]
MNKVRVGIIGAGWWATTAHIPAIKAHPGAELVAVQSRERAKAERIARDFGARHACISAEELLALPEVDAVIIASTPNVHHAQALAALTSGRHVLLEKPMTFTAVQARELVETAAQRNLHFVISCPWHYTAHAAQARELIQSGALGEIKLIAMLMTNPIDQLLRGVNTAPTHDAGGVYVEPRPGSYSDPAVAGGGQVYCQVSHAAAYLNFLTGFRAAEVFAQFDADGAATDIYDAINLKLENGTLVTIASTGATPRSERNFEVRIFGQKAILQLELWRGTMTLIDFQDRRTEFAPLASGEVYPAAAPPENFIDVILGRAANRSPGELGLASMEIIEAAGISARTGQLQVIRPVIRPGKGTEKPKLPALSATQMGAGSGK